MYGRGNHIPFVGRLFLPFQEPHSDKVRFNYGTLDVSLPLYENPTKTILYGIYWIFNRLTKPVNGYVHPIPFGSLSIFGPHPDERIMFKYGFLDIRRSLFNTYTLAKIVKSPSGHLNFANHKKLKALEAKSAPSQKCVGYMQWMSIFSKKKLYQIVRKSQFLKKISL